MRFFITCLFLLGSFSYSYAQIEANALYNSSNDTILSKDQDEDQLFKYLSGTWNIQGTWQVTEGQGKIKYTTRAVLSGVESYQCVLNGHYLEKSMKTSLSFYSRDYQKTKKTTYSALSMLTYNQNTDQFLMWSFDNVGNLSLSTGSVDSSNRIYSFESATQDREGNPVAMLYTLTIVNDNEYKWVIQKKEKGDYEWQIIGSGISKRKK